METKPIFRKDPEYYTITSLRLDTQNPRLPPEVAGYNQIELLVYMEEHYNLLPIARSMSDNGYFDEEPLIIIPKDDEPDCFIVIEGNRRLAALIFLTDPEIRARSAYKSSYDELADASRENLLQVPAIRYDARSETVAMLGFRHISGIIKWPAISKARFVHEFVRNNRELDFSQIARILGDQTSVIRRNYATYRIYIQSQTLGIDTSKIISNFSIFFVAIGRVAFQTFIGIRIRGSTTEELETPVPEANAEKLEELIKWIHGTVDERPLISESRDIRYLAAIIESPEALRYLRAGGRFLDAYSLTENEEQSIIDSFDKASFNIEETLRFLHRHRDKAEVHNAIERCAQSLTQALTHFPDIPLSIAAESE